MAAKTYYHAFTSEHERRPHLTGEISADICIIGGGLTGVSAALHLAERGYETVLLEAGCIGDGASGRNGGQVCVGYSSGMATFERVVGLEAAQRFWAMANEAINDIQDRIARYGIDADYRRGYIHAALNHRQKRGLQEMADSWSRTYGFSDFRILNREKTEAATGSQLYCGSLLEHGSGHMNPLAYLYGLARATESAGGLIFEESRAITIRKGALVVVETNAGRVKARMLVLAGNAYLGSLVPEIGYRIAPVLSAIAATAPLGADQVSRILPGDEAVADCNVALNYFRKTGDNRLLFGGLASYSGRPIATPAEALRRRMLKVYPALGAIPLDHVWSGKIAITTSRMPDFGRIGNNIYYAQGFSGHGLAITGLAASSLQKPLQAMPSGSICLPGYRTCASPVAPPHPSRLCHVLVHTAGRARPVEIGRSVLYNSDASCGVRPYLLLNPDHTGTRSMGLCVTSESLFYLCK